MEIDGGYHDTYKQKWRDFFKEKFIKGKRALELLGVSHNIGIENVIISKIDSKALFINLGIDVDLIDRDDYFIENEVNSLVEKVIKNNEKDVLKIVNNFSNFIRNFSSDKYFSTVATAVLMFRG